MRNGARVVYMFCALGCPSGQSRLGPGCVERRDPTLLRDGAPVPRARPRCRRSAGHCRAAADPPRRGDAVPHALITIQAG